ncbi:MAG: hypothetical protein V4695_03725 [Pseudomonadota bacterium]
MSQPRTDSGIPILTEIIAKTSDQAEVAMTIPPSPAEPEPHTTALASDNFDVDGKLQSTIQEEIADKVMQRLSAQFEALLDQHLHMVLNDVLQAAIGEVQTRLRLEFNTVLKETLGTVLKTVIKENIADEYEKSGFSKNKD